MFGIITSYLLLAGVAGIAGYVGYCFIIAPTTMTTNGTMPEDPPVTRPATIMDRLSYATKRSATLFVQLVSASFVMLGNALLSMADWFGSPEVRDWVTLHLTPGVASTVIVGLVGITIWARVRNATGA